jgi:hypothetical protein
VTLPPSLGDPISTAVLIARFTVHDRLGGPLRPHGRKPVGHVVTRVSGLAGLEIQPVGVLVFIIAVMRPVVDAGGLTVRIPGLDLPTTRLNLWLRPCAITTRQVNSWPGVWISIHAVLVVGVKRARLISPAQ